MEEGVIKEYERYFNRRVATIEAKNSKSYFKECSEKKLIGRNLSKGMKYLICSISLTPFILWIVLLINVLEHGEAENIGFGVFMMSLFCLGLCMKIYDYLLNIVTKDRK